MKLLTVVFILFLLCLREAMAKQGKSSTNLSAIRQESRNFKSDFSDLHWLLSHVLRQRRTGKPLRSQNHLRRGGLIRQYTFGPRSLRIVRNSLLDLSGNAVGDLMAL
jgi:hypothetical protein